MRKFTPAAIIILIAGSLTFLGACGGTKSGPGSSAGIVGPPPAVSVVNLERQTVPIFSEFVGSTFSEYEVQINPRVNGYILSRNFNPGDIVSAGQLLYTLDPRTYQAEADRLRAEVSRTESQLTLAKEGVDVLRAESELVQAEATLLKARQDVQRIAPLVRENALPEQDLDSANANQRVAEANAKARKAALDQQKLQQKSNIEQGTANLGAARAALEVAVLNLGYTRITAPVAGRIGETSIQTGGLAVANSTTPLTRISPLDPIYVEFKVSERDYLDYIRRDIATRQRTGASEQLQPLELILSDGSVYQNPGRYRYADRAVDLQTGTLKLIGEFPNPQRMLLPGQFGRVRWRTGRKEGVFLVPQRAVLEVQGLRYLLVVDKANKVAQRTVTATDRVGSDWVIESGLNDGDRVVVDGLQKAAPGSMVSPTLAQASPAAQGKR
jgi:membrane fusion protein, multidrug efflux system